MPELKCQHCGETFVAKLARAKWCSNSCKELARRIRDPNRDKREREKNPDRFRSASRKWREKNPDKVKEMNYRNNQKDPGRGKRRYWENPAKALDSCRASKNRRSAAASTLYMMHVTNQFGDQNDQPE